MVTLATIVKIWALLNLKTLPFVFHLRFYYYVVKNFYLLRQRRVLSAFEPTTMTTLCPMMEMDFNLHKSNSTYFTDMDISRTDLMSLVFRKFYREFSDSSAPKLKRHQWIFSPLGSTSMVFRREIRPYTPYQVESRIVGWTKKWLFVLSVFQSTSGKPKTIYAFGVSKYVLKQQRKTISPEEAIKFEGLLTPEAIEQNEKVQKFLNDSLDLEEIIKVAGY